MSKFRIYSRDYFRAISQALFLDNGYGGLALLGILFFTDRYLFVCGLIVSLIGHSYTILYSSPRALGASGLITLNGLFFGIAMASLFRESPALYSILIIGSLMLPSVTKATFELLQHWKLSPLIMPYILTVWVLWLCGTNFGLEIRPIELSEVPQILLPLQGPWSLLGRELWAIFQSMGRMFFMPYLNSGLAVLVLVTVFSPKKGFYFFCGTAIATFVAYGMSRDSSLWEHGLYSYSAGLVGLALASFQEKYGFGKIIFFCVISTFLTAAIEQFLGAQNLPTLSLPYVLTIWLSLLSRSPRINLNWTPNIEFNNKWGKKIVSQIDSSDSRSNFS